MGFSLFLIDSEQANINKLDKKGLLPISKMDKVTLNIEERSKINLKKIAWNWSFLCKKFDCLGNSKVIFTCGQIKFKRII